MKTIIILKIEDPTYENKKWHRGILANLEINILKEPHKFRIFTMYFGIKLKRPRLDSTAEEFDKKIINLNL